MKNKRKEAEKKLVEALTCPNSPELRDMSSFLKSRTANHVLGPEFEIYREGSLLAIDHLVELSGLSPGEFHTSLEVKIKLVLTPTTKAPREAKVIEIPIFEDTRD